MTDADLLQAMLEDRRRLIRVVDQLPQIARPWRDHERRDLHHQRIGWCLHGYGLGGRQWVCGTSDPLIPVTYHDTLSDAYAYVDAALTSAGWLL